MRIKPAAFFTASVLAAAAASSKAHAEPSLLTKAFELSRGYALSASRVLAAVFKPIVREAGMAICSDGRIKDKEQREWAEENDPWRQDGTAYMTGEGALDPNVVPYIVLPKNYRRAEMGDIALVSYEGKRIWTVCGDRGPNHKFGEGSLKTARALGVPDHPTTGGVASGVTYTIFPKTAGGPFAGEAELLAYLARKSAELERHAPPAR